MSSSKSTFPKNGSDHSGSSSVSGSSSTTSSTSGSSSTYKDKPAPEKGWGGAVGVRASGPPSTVNQRDSSDRRSAEGPDDSRHAAAGPRSSTHIRR